MLLEIRKVLVASQAKVVLGTLREVFFDKGFRNIYRRLLFLVSDGRLELFTNFGNLLGLVEEMNYRWSLYRVSIPSKNDVCKTNQIFRRTKVSQLIRKVLLSMP